MMEFGIRLCVTILALGFVVVFHEWGHLLVARALGVRVERFTIGFGPELFGWTSSGIRYAVCAVPLGGMVKLSGEFMDERAHQPDEFFSQPWYRRIAIALAGPVMNYLLAFLIFVLVAAAWGVFKPTDQPIVGSVIPGLPAAQSNLQAGDRILTVNGKAVATWEDMVNLIHGLAEKPVRLDVERTDEKGTSRQVIGLTPKRDPQQGVGLIGITPRVDRIKLGLSGSVAAGAHDVKAWTLQPLKYLGQKIAHWEGPKELSGPLGIFQMVSRSTKEGFSDLLYLIAIISTGLGLFNLFPIPVLDGGHILLYTIEGIVRRPLSRRVMQVANAVGLSVVLTIFLYASYQDILRWRLGFWK